MKKISELTKQELGHLIMTSNSYSSIYRKLGYTKVNNHTTLKSYMKKYEIDVSLLGISIENKRREIIMYNEGTKLNIIADSLIQEAIYKPETDCIIKEILITFSAYNLHDSFDVLIKKIDNCDNTPNTPNQLLVKEYSPMIYDLEIPLYTRIRAGEELVIRFNNHSKTEKNIFIKYHIEKVEKNIYEILADISKDWNNISHDSQFAISTLIAGEKSESKLLPKKAIIDLGKRIINSNNGKIETRINNTDIGIVSYEAMHQLLQEQFKLMCKDYYTFQANKYNIFEILSEIIDMVTPKTILPYLSSLFEIKVFKQGDKTDFKIRRKAEIKKNVSKANIAGNYNVFHLDNYILDIPTVAYGGTCHVSLESFIDGIVDFNEIIQIILDELILSIKRETHYALYQFGQRVTDNRVTGYGPDEWINRILPLIEKIDQEKGVCLLTGNKLLAGTILGEFKESPRKFDKHEVVLLPSYNNDSLDKHNRFVYVIPKGIDKMLLLALEGSTIIQDYTDEGMLSEFQAFKKMGIACVGNPLEIGLFEDTSMS